MPLRPSDVPFGITPPRAGDPTARTAGELLPDAAIGSVRLNRDGTVTDEEARRIERELAARGIHAHVDRAHNVTADGSGEAHALIV